MFCMQFEIKMQYTDLPCAPSVRLFASSRADNIDYRKLKTSYALMLLLCITCMLHHFFTCLSDYHQFSLNVIWFDIVEFFLKVWLRLAGLNWLSCGASVVFHLTRWSSYLDSASPCEQSLKIWSCTRCGKVRSPWHIVWSVPPPVLCCQSVFSDHWLVWFYDWQPPGPNLSRCDYCALSAYIAGIASRK